MKPKLSIFDDADAVAECAAEALIEAIHEQPNLILGLPTGQTPLAVYRRLVAAFEAGRVSFRQLATVNVDEYLGIGPKDPRSYAFYMRRHLFRYVDIAPQRTHVPNGLAADPAAEARRYEALIEGLGGIDCLLLGLGVNGHIAFNEPGSPRASPTRVVTLAPTTLAANRRFFAALEDQPTKAITIGIATILAARRIIVVAVGAAKAPAVQSLFQGKPLSSCPAAALRGHANTTVILDRSAAAGLPGASDRGDSLAKA